MELLVVLAVIAIFVGVFATAIRPGNPSVAVQGAQSQLAGLLTQTRGVAILRNAPARLIVNVDADDRDRYLRFLGIVYQDPDNPGNWLAATDGITLPGGAYVVTPSPNVAEDVSWNANAVSRFSTGSPFSIPYLSTTAQSYEFIEYQPNGTISAASSPVLAVASAQVSSDGQELEFIEPGNVRGVIVRPYGSFVLLNEPAAFPSE